jgi:hypothetical protein
MRNCWQACRCGGVRHQRFNLIEAIPLSMLKQIWKKPVEHNKKDLLVVPQGN